MATYCVDSAAGGLNDGGENGTPNPDWADAWVSIASAFTNAAAGDTVLADKGHAEDLNVNPNTTLTSAGTLANPIKFHCVDKADDSLSTGASVTNGGASNSYDLFLNGSFYSYGTDWSAGRHLYVARDISNRIEMEQCTVAAAVNTTGTMRLGNSFGNEIIFRDVDVDLSRLASAIYLYDTFIWRDGSFVTLAASVFNVVSDAVSCHVEGVDLSIQSNELVTRPIAGRTGRIELARCKLHAGAVALSAEPLLNPGDRLLLTHCQSGVDGDPSYAMESYSHYGDIKVETARYRTGGASDKERANPYSWVLESNANAKEIVAALESPPFGEFTLGNGSTEYTYTIYFASAFTVQDDEFSVELSVPNDDNTSSQAKILTSRLAPQGTPVNITTDGDSTWNGAGVGTKQKVVFTHTPDKPGLVEARLFLYKANATIYADPMIYITPAVRGNARAYLLPGYGNIYEGDVGAGGLLVHPGMDGGLVG